MTIDFAALPAPAVVEPLSFETILGEMLGDFQRRYPDYTALLASDPAMKLLEVAAYRELILRHRINEAAKGQLLAFATGSDLDHLAAFYGVARLPGERDERPRQWGACWLALELWRQLDLDSFWSGRLPPSREGTPWLKVLKTLVAYRLIDPGSEWRLHRQWFDASAMADLLEADFALVEKNTLYRCLDRLVAHKDELFEFLTRRWGELFGTRFDVLLYDLTSTYFETDTERGPGDLRQFGYSRDKRSDCRQGVIALIVTPEGFPLSYEVMAGNTNDATTLDGFLERIERRYGRAERIWVMDRGIPTEQTLAKMRAMGAFYLVGTPKGRLTKLEQAFLDEPWATVREGVKVQAPGHRGRPVRARTKRGAHWQGTRHAAKAAAPLCRAAEGAGGPEAHARPVADEAGCGAP